MKFKIYRKKFCEESPLLLKIWISIIEILSWNYYMISICLASCCACRFRIGFTGYGSDFQPFCWSRALRKHSSGSRNPCSHNPCSHNPCSHNCTREFEIAVYRSISVTSSGAPRLHWRSPKVLVRTIVYGNAEVLLLSQRLLWIL